MQVLLATCYSMNTQNTIWKFPILPFSLASGLLNAQFFSVWADTLHSRLPFQRASCLETRLRRHPSQKAFHDLPSSVIYSRQCIPYHSLHWPVWSLLNLNNVSLLAVFLLSTAVAGDFLGEWREKCCSKGRGTQAPRHKCGHKRYWQFRSGTLYLWREGLWAAGHHSLEPPIMEIQIKLKIVKEGNRIWSLSYFWPQW